MRRRSSAVFLQDILDVKFLRTWSFSLNVALRVTFERQRRVWLRLQVTRASDLKHLEYEAKVKADMIFRSKVRTIKSVLNKYEANF
jgi:hypothetical protein